MGLALGTVFLVGLNTAMIYVIATVVAENQIKKLKQELGYGVGDQRDESQ